MYNKISVKIIMILIMTAALAVPASVLQSHAQGDLQNTILKTHNDERKAVGVDPLTWSDSIAASAQNWADHLQPLGKQVHSTGTGYGENLAAGGGPSYATVDFLQGTWVKEKSQYVPGTPGNSHYTQMVDKQSKEVGCGFASGPGGQYAQYGGTNVLVCQYNPPGNFNSQPPY